MYRLMKSERYESGHLVSGSIPNYRQIDVAKYQHLCKAMGACEAASETVNNSRHYVLNDAGKEFFGGTWID